MDFLITKTSLNDVEIYGVAFFQILVAQAFNLCGRRLKPAATY
jgi:hypothetical protein